MSEMIPSELDIFGILVDLNSWGWSDYKIEIVCGFSANYIGQVKCRNIKFLAYQRAARLYNFWCSELELHSKRTHLQNQVSAVTT